VTISDVLSAAATEWGSRTAVIYHDRQVSFRELDILATRCAQGLTELGVGLGDRVLLSAPNSDGFTVAYHGIMRAGASAVTVNPLLKGPEFAYIIGDCRPKAAILLTQLAEPVLEGARLAEWPMAVVSMAGPLEGAEALETMLARDASNFVPPRVPDDACAAVLYTSGTTGRPKGAMLSHHNIVFDARAAAGFFQFLPDDRLLVVLPMFHAYGGTVGIVVPAVIGATTVPLERFTPKLVFDAIAKHRVTLCPAVPSMYSALLRAADAESVQADVSSVRFFISGGSAMPPALQRAFEQRFGVEICEGDGPTECGPVTCANVPHRKRKIGTVGLAVPGIEIRAVDDQSREVPSGQIGELVVRGENVFMGYLNQSEATAEAMRGGWFHTGDLGFIDEEGYITIVDRKRDLVIVGGLNVYPREVEDVLVEHPGVAEVAVIGIPDDLRGERVKAFVAPREGWVADERELLRHCRGRLANYKVPKTIEFRDELPKSQTGKVLRRQLREETSSL